MIFENREHAGIMLSRALPRKLYKPEETIILAIPRGGIPITYKLSRITNIKFGIIVVKKLSPLKNKEFGFGAMAKDGTTVIDKNYQKYLQVDDKEYKKIEGLTLKEIGVRIKKYGDFNKSDVVGKNVVIVDDGVATGFTACVTAKYLKKLGVKKIIIAVPVCPINSIQKLKEFFDDIICLYPIKSLSFAVGQFYKDFHQVEDIELLDLIKKAKNEKLYIGK